MHEIWVTLNVGMQDLQQHIAACTFFSQSLKKKVEILQRTLSTPTRTNEALSRLVFERLTKLPS